MERTLPRDITQVQALPYDKNLMSYAFKMSLRWVPVPYLRYLPYLGTVPFPGLSNTIRTKKHKKKQIL